MTALRQRGFTTLELLVATSIGIFILAGAALIMANSKKNYTNNTASSRLQENARFAMTTLAYDVRMAGHLGCAGTDDSLINPIAGIEGDPSALLSDSFTIQYADPRPGVFELAAVQPVSPTQIQVINSDSTSATRAADIFKSGDTIVMADCGSAELHDVLTVNGNTITLDGTTNNTTTPNGTTLNASTQSVTQIMRLMSYEYTIDFDTTTRTPTLFRTDNGGAREPLIEGIEYLRVLFGIDTTGDNNIDAYVAPTTVAAGTRITNVKLGLLARTVSYENVTPVNGGQYGRQPDTKTYQILDITDYDPPDDRVSRKVFTNNLRVRNG